jgi:glucokinase
MTVLSGDIGGTTTRLQLTNFTDTGDITVLKRTHYSNHDYVNLVDIIDAFFKQDGLGSINITGACFDVAGPIVDGMVVKLTNLPWTIKTDEIRNKLKIDNVTLINDFAAIGYGIDTLQSKDLFVLQQKEPRVGGLKAYLGAGTGLGVGFITYNQGIPRVYPTEGGHIDFAPTDDIQIELLKFLRQKYHRVSFERVLSGPGLVNIYQFVRSYRGFSEKENKDLNLLVDGKEHFDIAAAIAEYAIEHSDPLAIQALNIFIRIYAAATGNLALTSLPFGGLYIVGGIAPKLLSLINSTLFFDAFGDKGRMSDLIKSIPIYVVLYTDVGLRGAAWYANNSYHK